MADDPAVAAAARAYCATQFNYDGPYVSPTGAADHLTYDAASMTDAPWLLAVVAAVRPVLAREAFNEAAEAIEAKSATIGPDKYRDEWLAGRATGLDEAARLVRGLGGETQHGS